MTQEDIIRMARETRLAFDSEEYPDIWQTHMNVGRDEIERFAALVAAAEREACAKVCDVLSDKHSFEGCYANECAAAIRARG